MVGFIYIDTSVLENYHIAQSFKVIKSNQDYNIFSGLSPSEYKTVRKRIIDCVLATDMVFHGKQVVFLKGKIETFSIKEGVNSEQMIAGLDANGLNALQQEFMNVFIHGADISNPTKPFHIYSKWADRVMNEFWCQGDKEREHKLPISFLCDRYSVKLPGAQLGFMDNLVLPFMLLVNEIFPGLKFLVENISNNKVEYRMIKEQEEKK
jgi:cAMP-specific phosphodiesterase 4